MQEMLYKLTNPNSDQGIVNVKKCRLNGLYWDTGFTEQCNMARIDNPNRSIISDFHRKQ